MRSLYDLNVNLRFCLSNFNNIFNFKEIKTLDAIQLGAVIFQIYLKISKSFICAKTYNFYVNKIIFKYR